MNFVSGHMHEQPIYRILLLSSYRSWQFYHIQRRRRVAALLFLVPEVTVPNHSPEIGYFELHFVFFLSSSRNVKTQQLE
jgi:hypothetical protein